MSGSAETPCTTIDVATVSKVSATSGAVSSLHTLADGKQEVDDGADVANTKPRHHRALSWRERFTPRTRHDGERPQHQKQAGAPRLCSPMSPKPSIANGKAKPLFKPPSRIGRDHTDPARPQK